jgi:Fe-S cluster biogenesis protein NfuA
MRDITEQVHEVLHNLDWLLEAHNSSVELVGIDGIKVTVRCLGACADCETNCVEVAFKERIPDIELVFQ